MIQSPRQTRLKDSPTISASGLRRVAVCCDSICLDVLFTQDYTIITLPAHAGPFDVEAFETPPTPLRLCPRLIFRAIKQMGNNHTFT